MFVGDKNENKNFKNMACAGSFARVVGNLGTSLSNRQTALIVRIFANRHTSHKHYMTVI